MQSLEELEERIRNTLRNALTSMQIGVGCSWHPSSHFLDDLTFKIIADVRSVWRQKPQPPSPEVHQPQAATESDRIRKLQELHQEQMMILRNCYEERLEQLTRSHNPPTLNDPATPIARLNTFNDNPISIYRRNLSGELETNQSEMFLDAIDETRSPFHRTTPFSGFRDPASLAPEESLQQNRQLKDVASTAFASTGQGACIYPPNQLAIEFYGNKILPEHQQVGPQQHDPNCLSHNNQHSESFSALTNAFRQELDAVRNRVRQHQQTYRRQPSKDLLATRYEHVSGAVANRSDDGFRRRRLPLEPRCVHATNTQPALLAKPSYRRLAYQHSSRLPLSTDRGRYGPSGVFGNKI